MESLTLHIEGKRSSIKVSQGFIIAMFSDHSLQYYDYFHPDRLFSFWDSMQLAMFLIDIHRFAARNNIQYDIKYV